MVRQFQDACQTFWTRFNSRWLAASAYSCTMNQRNTLEKILRIICCTGASHSQGQLAPLAYLRCGHFLLASHSIQYASGEISLSNFVKFSVTSCAIHECFCSNGCETDSTATRAHRLSSLLHGLQRGRRTLSLSCYTYDRFQSRYGT